MEITQSNQTIDPNNNILDEMDLNNSNINNRLNISYYNGFFDRSIKRIENIIIFISLFMSIFIFTSFVMIKNIDYKNLVDYKENIPSMFEKRKNNGLKYNLEENTYNDSTIIFSPSFNNNLADLNSVKNSDTFTREINSKNNQEKFIEKKYKERKLFNKFKETNEELRFKENIFKDIFRYSYIGNWTSDSKIMNFENNSGEIRIMIHLAINFKFRDVYASYFIFLYDGDERKKWMLIQNKLGLSLNSTKVEKLNDQDKLEIKHNNMLVVASEFDIFDNIQKNYLSMNLNYFLERSITNNISGKIDNMIFSKENFSINFTINKEKVSFYSKISSFSLCICLLGIMQTVNLRKLLENLERNPDLAKDYSPVMIYISNIWNAYISFGLFYFALLDERLFNKFIIPTLLFFLNFSYLELKLIITIWKSEVHNRSTEFITMYILRNRFTKFYILFFVLFAFIYDSFLNNYFQYIITAITFLPQIFHDLLKGTKNKISFGTILTISCNRLFIPIYFRSCPNNFLGIAIDYDFTYIISILLILQLFMMIIQKIFKVKYLYRRTNGRNEFKYEKTVKDLKNEAIDIESSTCAICLGEFVSKKEIKLDKNDNSLKEIHNKNENTNLETTSINFEIQTENYPFYIKLFKSFKIFFKKCFESKKKEFMLTPCKHLFHKECLKLWLEKKNGCPVCRHDLPQYND